MDHLLTLTRRSLKDPLTESIRLLNKIAIKLKQKRIAAGALSLSSPELKIHLDSNENAPEPIDVEQKAQLETNSLGECLVAVRVGPIADAMQSRNTCWLAIGQPPKRSWIRTLKLPCSGKWPPLATSLSRFTC